MLRSYIAVIFILIVSVLAGWFYFFSHRSAIDVKIATHDSTDYSSSSDFVDPIFLSSSSTLPVSKIEPAAGERNFLLLGQSGENLDTIILANVDDEQDEITLISIPRDLLVDSYKINSHFHRFGMDPFVEKLEQLSGRKIDYYALADMDIFPELIDKLGGIDFEFEKELDDPSYRTVDDGVVGTLHFSAGWTHLNGVQALRVARSRHTSDDFSRAARQQKIIAAVRSKISGISEADLLLSFAPFVLERMETDLGLYEAVPLVLKIKDYKIKPGYVISSGNILDGKTIRLSNGQRMYILEPRGGDWGLIKKFISEKIAEE